MFDYYSNLLKLLFDTPCVQVTVIDKKGSVPTEIGAKMLVTMEGLAHGTIGGGRVEKKTIEHCINLLQESEDSNSKKHEVTNWSLGKDLGMTCGGTITFFFEVMNNNIWKIVIFGAGHVASALIKLLNDINCHITCIDFREEWLDKLPESEKLYKVRLDEMSDYVEKIKTNAFVLITTPGHKYDLEVLSKCIDKDFPYLGVIGSKAKAAFLRKELIKLGFSEEMSQKFYCPMGLPLGTNEPHEVAISIVSHLIQERDKLIGSKHWKNLQSKDFLLNNH